MKLIILISSALFITSACKQPQIEISLDAATPGESGFVNGGVVVDFQDIFNVRHDVQLTCHGVKQSQPSDWKRARLKFPGSSDLTRLVASVNSSASENTK